MIVLQRVYIDASVGWEGDKEKRTRIDVLFIKHYREPDFDRTIIMEKQSKEIYRIGNTME